MKEKEHYITLSTLKKIFTQKHINKHFPEPDFYQTDRSNGYYKVEMQMFNLNAVLQAIATGVPTRINLTEDYQHYQTIMKVVTKAKFDSMFPPKGNTTIKKTKI